MLRIGDHLKRHGEPVPAAVEAGVQLPVQGVQPEGFQVLVVQGQELGQLVPDDSCGPGRSPSQPLRMRICVFLDSRMSLGQAA